MLIELKTGQTFQNIYVRGSFGDEYFLYTMSLRSKYNNLNFNNDQTFSLPEQRIGLIKVETNERWTHFRTNLSQFPSIQSWFTKDFGGYYEFVLEGVTLDEPENYVLLDSRLCRVINEFTEKPDIQYLSNNENNEQFTYYNG